MTIPRPGDATRRGGAEQEQAEQTEQTEQTERAAGDGDSWTCAGLQAVFVRIALLENRRADLAAQADQAPKMRDRIRLRFAEASLAQDVELWRLVAGAALLRTPSCLLTGTDCALEVAVERVSGVVHRSPATATGVRGRE